MLPKKGCPIILEVYTERWPCDSCEGVLTKYAKEKNDGNDIPVYFIAPAGGGEDLNSAEELLTYGYAVFGYNWWD